MGVPKFYRWLSERYPCLSEVVKEHQIPEFDNLYLDMNGIIHNCSHPNDDDPHFRITEEKIFADIFHYIEVLFRMIQPKKVFFMAIDGVAPRAKMNQQRGRRFRSAKEAEVNAKRAKDRGEELPTDAAFDSNCITPGTPFMCRLHDQLKYFVSMKISTDTLWQGVKVILSGHETPGEGEHKVMDYIRFEKAQPGYDPNIRHCLYGLDADLVMLGLCTHDPHFSLLREEVRFGGKKTGQKRTVTPEETTFHLLHLSLLREYMDHEFSDLKREGKLPFEYDLEAVIDDWILMGFLVGNDFLPHLPHLHINKGALSELYETYKDVLPKLGGYMNCGGILQVARFEKFLAALAEKEMDRFEDIYSDAKWLEGKTAKKVYEGGPKIVTDTPGPANVEEMLCPSSGHASATTDDWEIVSHNKNKKDGDLMRLLQSADDFLLDSSEGPTESDSLCDTDVSAFEGQSECRDNLYHIEFRQHKREYYIRKLGYPSVTAEVLNEQAEGYVRAIQWNLHYYYNGCVSWSWYYPHHYAPWITDIRGVAETKMVFDLGHPFLPFEQLLSVLPAASKDLLPPLLQGLMINPSSPILDFYPKDFENDLNGKQQEWEAVVLVPFIDEKRLQEASTPLFSHLTKEEQSRNKHGPMLAYEFTQQPLGPYPAPQYFPAVERNFAMCQDLWREYLDVPIEKLKKGLMVGVKLDVFFPGFPTLKHIPHKAMLKKEAVKVFEQNSRGYNMMLKLEDQGRPNIHEVASQLLDKEIWVAWPHMVEAKVVSVSSYQHTYCIGKNGQPKNFPNEPKDMQDFSNNVGMITERYKMRWGVMIGDTPIVLNSCVMTGRKYVCAKEGKITLEKQWSNIPQAFALQTTRKDILVHDPSFTQFRTLPELFPLNSLCFVIGHPHYGCEASVLKIDKEHRGRVQLSVVEPTEPSLGTIRKLERKMKEHYFPGFKAAQRLGISSHLLSRITGAMFVIRGPREAEIEFASKINIGLNLKNNKRNEEVSGFTRRGQDNNWLYSGRTVDVIRHYMGYCPELYEYLSVSERVSGDQFHHSDIFPEGDGDDRLKELASWIKELPSSTASRQPCGTITLDEAVTKAIEEEVAATITQQQRNKQIVMQVKPHLIFKPNLSKGSNAPDPDTTFELFDRVVNVREGFSVPLGLRGTVIGLLKAARPEDAMVEVLFDREFQGGLCIRSSPGRAYRVPRSALINISHGQRKNQPAVQHQPQESISHTGWGKPTAVVTPMDQQSLQGWSKSQQMTHQDVLRRSSSQEDDAVKSIPVAVKHVTPPDPKNLPMPIEFLSQAPPPQHAAADQERYRGQAEAQNNPTTAGQLLDMQQLWQVLQQQPPIVQQQMPPVVSLGQVLDPNVQQFFAMHQQHQHHSEDPQMAFFAPQGPPPHMIGGRGRGGRPMPPRGPPPFLHQPTPNGRGRGLSPPAGPDPNDDHPQRPGLMNFVPLQAQRRGQDKTRQHHRNVAQAVVAPPQQLPLQNQPPPQVVGNGAAQAHFQPPKQQVGNRNPKSRLAANFGPEK